MFLGQYRHTIDIKGRLTIPARYRELLEDGGAYLLRGFDRNLMVMPAPVFENITRHVNRMNLTNPGARDLRRFIFSRAEQLEFDRNGRILIPQFLRDEAHINTEATLVGGGEYFEIWAPDLWDQHTQLQFEDADAQRFAAFDLYLSEE